MDDWDDEGRIHPCTWRKARTRVLLEELPSCLDKRWATSVGDDVRFHGFEARPFTLHFVLPHAFHLLQHTTPRSSAHATRRTPLPYPSEKKLPPPPSRPRVHLLSRVHLLHPPGEAPTVHLRKGSVSAGGTSFRARGRVDGDARSYGAHFCARQHARWQRLVDVSHERQQGADEGEELHVPGAEACGWLEATSKEKAGGGPHVCCDGVCSNEAMRSRKEEEKRRNEWKERRRGRGWTARADQTRVLQVVVNEGEPPESALRRFRRAVMSSGVIPEVRGRETVHAWMDRDAREEEG